MDYLQITSVQQIIKPDSALINKIDNIDIVAKGSEMITDITTKPFKEWVMEYITPMATFGLKVVVAIALFILGRWLIKIIDRGLTRTFERRHAERSIAMFTRSIIRVALYIVLFIIVVGTLGVKSTSFAMVLAAMMFAVGMALSGALQNFAGGIILIMVRPFSVGDYIEAQGFEGEVKEIKLSNTHIITHDNRTVQIPNGALSTGTVTNYSSQKVIRVNFRFQISYGDNVDRARELVLSQFKGDPRILTKPAPYIAVESFGDSGINIVARCWVKYPDYWSVLYQVNEKIYSAITTDPEVNFPFPQMDVHFDDNRQPKQS